MSLEKQPVDVRFGEGLDQKKDPKQVSLGRFLRLVNTVFTKGARLTKRFGYPDLTNLPHDSDTAVLTTFQQSLVALGGTKVQAYSASSETWQSRGSLTPVALGVAPVARPNATVTQCDTAVAASPLTGELGLACTVFATSAPAYFYQVTDATTGSTVVPTTAIPATGGATVTGVAKAFVLGRYFVVVFSASRGGTDILQYFAINLTDPTMVSTPVDLTTSYVPAATTAWDGVVANNNLYVAWNGGDGGGAVRMSYVDSTLIQHSTVAFAGQAGTVFGVTADTSGSTPTVWVTYANLSSYVKALAVGSTLVTVLAPTTLTTDANAGNLAPYAANGTATVFYELFADYAYEASPNNSIKKVTVTSAGVVGTPGVVVHGAGLASKPFVLGAVEPAILSLYSGRYQNGYFLLAPDGRVLCKTAYLNATTPVSGYGYLKAGLPSPWTVLGSTSVGFLQADAIQPVNRTQGSTAPATFLQTGASLASFTPDVVPMSAEIGGSLVIAAGLVSEYDGSAVYEHGFNVWPDNVKVTTSGSGGSIAAQTYFYQATYEHTDAQGYLHRSAPSVPVGVTTTGATSTNTIKVPTYRLTQKAGVRIVLYRWSTTQPFYYQALVINNDPTAELVTFTDTQADSAILGKTLLYTTGGVVENIGPPPCNVMALYRSRALLVDAEDRNSVWFSKVVAEATPVEFNDGFTVFCAPTLGSQGSTGPITALGALDDKFIIFKKDAAYYETGQGPDATGASNDFQDPTFIASCVGCANPQSIVVFGTEPEKPEGLIFQSDKGRWLLGRNLTTRYVGAPVDDLNDLVDTSALTVPATNQVRITTQNGPTLVYDYYYDQWSTFTTQVRSACIVDGVHTTIDRYGRVRQEASGTYLDGSDPVLIGFTSGWGNLAGLQGFERAYFLLLEGSYFSPFLLDIGLAYDYVPTVVQQVTIVPDAPNAAFGGDPTFGASAAYGGANTGRFEPRIFLTRQKCESFQVTLQERYDPSYGVPAGQGLNLSGMTAVVGLKKGYRTQRQASDSFG